MTSVDEIVCRLEDLSSEAQSTKVTVRNKAIDQLKQMFDTLSLSAILSGQTHSTLEPKQIFINIFEGMFKVRPATNYL